MSDYLTSMFSDESPWQAQNCVAELNCHGKPEPRIGDRFEILGQHQIIIGVTSYNPPVWRFDMAVTHRIEFRPVYPIK